MKPGDRRFFPVAGRINELLFDSSRCYVYGLTYDNGHPTFPSDFVVFDGSAKRESKRITLPPAQAFAVSQSGAYIVVANWFPQQLVVIDPADWSTKAIQTGAVAWDVQVADDGFAYYVSLANWSDLHRVNLATGEDVVLNVPPYDWQFFSPTVRLSPDENELYVGESGGGGTNLYLFSVADGGFSHERTETFSRGSTRALYVSLSGQHVYYAYDQLDESAFSVLASGIQERILLEDGSGRVAIGEFHAFDPRTMTSTSVLDTYISAATLAAGGQEVWTYSPETGAMTYQNIADLIP